MAREERPLGPLPDLTRASRARRQEVWAQGQARAVQLRQEGLLRVPAGFTTEEASLYLLGVGQEITGMARELTTGVAKRSWDE